MLLGLYDKAIAKHEITIQLNPNYDYSYEGLAETYLYKDGFLNYEWVEKMTQLDSSARNLEYAASLYILNNKEKAREYVEKTLESSGYDARVQYMLPIIQAYLLTIVREGLSGNFAESSNAITGRFN